MISAQNVFLSGINKKIIMKPYTQAVHKSKKLTMHSTTLIHDPVLINFQHVPPQKVKILTVSLSSGHAIVVCQFHLALLDGHKSPPCPCSTEHSHNIDTLQHKEELVFDGKPSFVFSG